MADYRTLDAWKRAYEVTLTVYRATKAYPRTETFGLVAQTRRAAISVPANLAEGAGRGSNRDYARFVGIAIGSAHELEFELRLAKDLGYLTPDDWRWFESELALIRSMLTLLRQRLLITPDLGR